MLLAMPDKSRKASVLTARISKLKRRLRDKGVDGLIISNPVDIRYLTGFIGDDSLALVTAGRAKVLIISDSRFEEQIAREAPDATVLIRTGSMGKALADSLAKKKLTKVGVQGAHLTLAGRKAWADAIRKAKTGAKLTSIDDRLLHDRAVKTPEEIRCIRKAISIQQQAFENVLAQLKPGMTEYEIAAHLEYEMRLLGADGPSFPSIIASGPNAALPHAIPGKAKLRRNVPMLFDFGAKYNGYCSDITRVICLGPMPRKMASVYQIVLDAQMAAIDLIAPGVALADVDQAARDMISRAGYGKQFGHSLGHGIGLNIHEQPVLSKKSKGVLEPGQIVTVEPGIYLPGVGGIRIEDDVLVTKTGHSVLTSLGKTMTDAVIR